jgi:hypothetical protein
MIARDVSANGARTSDSESQMTLPDGKSADFSGMVQVSAMRPACPAEA